MLGETLGRSKVADVDERVFGQVLSIVGATVDNGHHVVGHRPEQFLGDVVGAQRVLEGQVEAVVVAQQVVAGARAPALGVAVEAAAVAVDVHVDVPRQGVDEPLALARRLTVRHEPGHGTILARYVHARRRL